MAEILNLQQQLGIDATFFTQFLIFIFIYAWLHFVFFGPYLKLIQSREGKSDGLSDEALKLEEESSRLEAQYAEAWAAMKKKTAAEKDQIVSVGRKEAAGITGAAREQAKEKMNKAREESAKSFAAEIASLKQQVGSISSLLMEKLTKTKVGL
jgi:F0F1-type ATP synthase membrane subunit b/b'